MGAVVMESATMHSLGVRGMSASMSLKSGLKTLEANELAQCEMDTKICIC
jgi:hypothetical protein